MNTHPDTNCIKTGVQLWWGWRALRFAFGLLALCAALSFGGATRGGQTVHWTLCLSALRAPIMMKVWLSGAVRREIFRSSDRRRQHEWTDSL